MGSKKAAIGIDPGHTGALALVNDDELIIYDYEGIEAADQALTDLQRDYDIRFALLEKVWIRQKERNVTAINQLVRNAAMWDCLLHVHGIPHDEVSPQTWRKTLISEKKAATKANLVAKAKKVFDIKDGSLDRHDRAEAALIGYRAWADFKSGWSDKRIKKREGAVS